mgnify:CR=1 FL=1|jgi:SPP1 family predicted phage head-tail adaptor
MIGSRRHLITIQKNTPTRVKGVRADVWSTLASVYAEIKTLGGGERQAADQREMVATHKITMRYRASAADITRSRYRVTFSGKTFDVRGVVHPDPRKELTIMRVQEVVT